MAYREYITNCMDLQIQRPILKFIFVDFGPIWTTLYTLQFAIWPWQIIACNLDDDVIGVGNRFPVFLYKGFEYSIDNKKPQE